MTTLCKALLIAWVASAVLTAIVACVAWAG